LRDQPFTSPSMFSNSSNSLGKTARHNHAKT
jgi:hypothetical protein